MKVAVCMLPKRMNFCLSILASAKDQSRYYSMHVTDVSANGNALFSANSTYVRTYVCTYAAKVDFNGTSLALMTTMATAHTYSTYSNSMLAKQAYHTMTVM